LFLREMPAQLGVEFIAYIRRRLGHGIGHAQQRLFRRGETIETSAADGDNLFISQSVYSAPGRIGVNSKWTAHA
jgi:hypothetical protein